MNEKRNKVYKCAHSGLTLEVLTDDNSCVKLECCGEEMVCLQEKTDDSGKEKHVPVISGDDKGVKVTVGTIAHPMDEAHHIVWIEIINGQYVNRKYLTPGEPPVAEFYVPMQRKIQVRSYCNLHGLWKGNI